MNVVLCSRALIFLSAKLALICRIGDNFIFFWRPGFERLHERAARSGSSVCHLDAWIGS